MIWARPEEEQITFRNSAGQVITTLTGNFACRSYPYPHFDLSSDGKYLAYGCKGHLLVLSMADNSTLCDIELPESIHHGEQRIIDGMIVSEATWSLDGKWIVFSWQATNMLFPDDASDPISGIYFVDVSDTEQSIQCGAPKKAKRALERHIFDWTHSNLLTVVDNDRSSARIL